MSDPASLVRCADAAEYGTKGFRVDGEGRVTTKQALICCSWLRDAADVGECKAFVLSLKDCAAIQHNRVPLQKKS